MSTRDICWTHGTFLLLGCLHRVWRAVSRFFRQSLAKSWTIPVLLERSYSDGSAWDGTLRWKFCIAFRRYYSCWVKRGQGTALYRVCNMATCQSPRNKSHIHIRWGGAPWIAVLNPVQSVTTRAMELLVILTCGIPIVPVKGTFTL
jgi:hypothetical protein